MGLKEIVATAIALLTLNPLTPANAANIDLYNQKRLQEYAQVSQLQQELGPEFDRAIVAGGPDLPNRLSELEDGDNSYYGWSQKFADTVKTICKEKGITSVEIEGQEYQVGKQDLCRMGLAHETKSLVNILAGTTGYVLNAMNPDYSINIRLDPIRHPRSGDEEIQEMELLLREIIGVGAINISNPNDRIDLSNFKSEVYLSGTNLSQKEITELEERLNDAKGKINTLRGLWQPLVDAADLAYTEQKPDEDLSNNKVVKLYQQYLDERDRTFGLSINPAEKSDIEVSLKASDHIARNLYLSAAQSILSEYGIGISVPIMPIFNPSELDDLLAQMSTQAVVPATTTILERKKKIGRDKKRIEKDPLYEKLLEAGIAEENVAQIVEAAAEFRGEEGIKQLTTGTYSKSVLQTTIEIDGQKYRVFGKIGDKVLQHQQAEYFRLAAQNPLTQVITPKVLSLVDDPNSDATLQFTYDTTDSRIVPNETIKQYFATRLEAFKELEKRTGIDAVKLQHDPLAIDCFNIALSHTYMRAHKEDETFASSLSTMEDAETLDLLLHLDKKDLLKGLPVKKIIEMYKAHQDEVREYNAKPTILAIGDNREENIFPDAYSGLIRVIGDPMPRPGTEVFDLSRRNLTPEQAKKAMAYTSILRNYLEQQREEDFEFSGKDVQTQQAQLGKQALVQAIFLGDYFAKTGRMDDTIANLSTAAKYLKQ